MYLLRHNGGLPQYSGVKIKSNNAPLKNALSFDIFQGEEKVFCDFEEGNQTKLPYKRGIFKNFRALPENIAVTLPPLIFPAPPPTPSPGYVGSGYPPPPY